MNTYNKGLLEGSKSTKAGVGIRRVHADDTPVTLHIPKHLNTSDTRYSRGFFCSLEENFYVHLQKWLLFDLSLFRKDAFTGNLAIELKVNLDDFFN